MDLTTWNLGLHPSFILSCPPSRTSLTHCSVTPAPGCNFTHCTGTTWDSCLYKSSQSWKSALPFFQKSKWYSEFLHCTEI